MLTEKNSTFEPQHQNGDIGRFGVKSEVTKFENKLYRYTLATP